MGHAIGKEIYRKLGRKIDNLTMRAPWNETFHAILKELYSAEEADLVVKIPYGLSSLGQIGKITKRESPRLEAILDRLCAKGLVMDLWVGDQYYYTVSPLVIGIFEFTMMRTGDNLNTKEWARLFHSYMQDDDSFYGANFAKDKRISPLRTLPHEDAIDTSEYVEVLDYEKATAIVEGSRKFSIGICSCRHEKLHVNEKKCGISLDTCSTFNDAADYMIRHNFAREVSKSEMLENLARSKEMGLVFNADNVQREITFICHCCGCCCNVLLGISKFGYPNTVVTSSFIAKHDEELCAECGRCAQSCPIGAIEILPQGGPEIDASICLGCGVCSLQCQSGALTLIKRQQRVIHPETTVERVILQCLERGTLQNQMFKNPRSMTHIFLRAFLGAFLKLSPVKKALMSDMLRSSFLEIVKRGA